MQRVHVLVEDHVKHIERGCADDPEEWCIAVGDMADYIVETNKGGHYITKERALEILKQAEDNGLYIRLQISRRRR